MNSETAMAQGLPDLLLGSETSEAEKRRILQDEYAIPMAQSVEQEMSVMCNLSKGAAEKDLAMGRAEGAEKTALENLKSLIGALGLSAGQAMDALMVPESDRPKYPELLERQ